MKWYYLHIKGWQPNDVNHSFNFLRTKIKRDRLLKVLNKQVEHAITKDCDTILIEILPYSQAPILDPEYLEEVSTA